MSEQPLPGSPKRKWHIRDLPMSAKLVGLVLLPLAAILTMIAVQAAIAINRMDSETTTLLLQEEARVIGQEWVENETVITAETAHLASDATLISAVQRRDPDAAQSVMLTHLSQSHLDYIQVVDQTGAPLGQAQKITLADPEGQLRQFVTLGTIGFQTARLIPTPQGWLIAVVWPLQGPTGLVGAVVAGQLIDDAFLYELNWQRNDPLVMVLDAQGQISAITHPPDRPVHVEAIIPDPQLVTAASRGQTRLGSLQIGHVTQDAAYMPLIIGGRPDGVVIITLASHPLDQLRQSLLTNNLLLISGHALLAILLILFINRRFITGPLQELTASARQITTGRLDVAVPHTQRRDEIGALADAFNSMVGQLKDSLRGLQQQMTELSQASNQMQSRAARFQAMSEIARTITSERDLDQLLPLVTRLISERFGFYHVGIFLLDEAGQYAVLRAANSEGGQKMLARGHRLAVGEAGVVGYVTGSGQPRIAADTGTDAVFLPNPDLPQTRSEMTLPLKVHEQVIGALDLQSTQPDAFEAEDLTLFGTLADQVAIAIDNSRLLERQTALAELNQQLLRQSEQAVAELNMLTRRLTAEGWQEYLATQRGGVVVEDQAADLAIAPRPLPALDQAATSVTPVTTQDENQSAVAFPILLRNEVIGTLGLADVDPSRQWSEDDLIIIREVSEQVALALDNARLIQETGRRSEELAALNRMVAAVASTLDLETILGIVADELITRFSLGHVGIALLNEDRTALVVQADRSRVPGMASSVGTVIPIAGNPAIQKVLATRTTLVIPDAQHDPLMAPVQDLMRQRGVQSTAILPLIAGGDVIGTIDLDIVDPGRTLTPDEIRLAETMVTQVSTAIQNARLYARTEEQAQTLARQVNALSMLVESTQAITSTLEFNQVIDTLVHAAARQLNAQTAALAVIEEGSDTLQLVASVGFPEDLAHSWSVRVGEGMSGQVAQTGQPLAVDDVNQDGRAKYPSINVAQGLVSYLGVPVSSRGRTLGVLSVMTSEQRHFSEEEVSLLSALANQAAAAIDNSRLFAEVRRRLENLADLNEASRALSATIDLEALPGIIYEQCRQLIPFDAFYVAFYDATRNEIEFPILAEGDQITRSGRRPLGEGMIAWVIQHRQPLHIRSLEEDRPPSLARFGSERPSASILVMPMIAGDRVMGALSVQSYTPNAFDASHVQVLSTLSNQAAIAIQNARLYQETQQRVTELSVVNRISQVISSTLDITSIYQALGEQIRQALHTDTMQLVLYDEERQLLHYPILIDEGQSISIEPLPVIGLSGHIIRTREPLLLSGEELEKKRQELGSRVIGSAKPAHSYLGVPLVLGEKAIGVLNVQDLNRPDAFDQSDLRTLTTIAAQVAIAIQNARLYEETRQRVTELSILNQINAAISSALDLDQVLQLIYDQISRLLENTSFYVALYDADKDEVSFPLAVENNEKRPWTARRGGQGMTEWIIHNRQPVLIKEGADKFNVEHGIQMIGLLARSWMGVPLFLGDQIKGVMAVQHFTKDNAFSEQDLHLFEAIGRQAAIAIQNAQLHQETRQRVTELSILNQINAAISAALDLDQVLELVHTQISRLIENTSFYVALYNELKNEITFPYYVDHGERKTFPPRPGGQGLTGWIIANRQAVRLGQGEVEFRREHGIVSGARALNRSWMGIPLFLGDQVRGVMAVQHATKDNAFDEQTFHLFEALGRQVIVAIENARLYEEAQSRIQELTSLQAVGIATSSSLDLHQILEGILQSIQGAIVSDVAGVTMYNHETQTITVAAAQGRDADALLGISFNVHQGLSGWVCQERQPVIVADASQDPRHYKDSEATAWFRSFVAVPILFENWVFGTIFIAHATPDLFHEDQMRFLSIVANQAASALRNVELFAETRRRLEEMEVINQIGQAISATLDLPSLHRTIYEQIGRVMDASDFYIVDYDPETGIFSFPFKVEAGIEVSEITDPPRPIAPRGDPNERLVDYLLNIRQPILIKNGVNAFCDANHLHPLERDALSWLGVPMAVGEKIVGAIVVHRHDQPNVYSESDRNLLATVAVQAASAIENARLYAEIRRWSAELEQRVEERTLALAEANTQLSAERDRLDALYQITRELASSLDLDWVLNHALALAATTVGATNGSIMLVDLASGSLKYRAALGLSKPLPPGGELTPFKPGVGLAGWVLQERQAVIVDDVTQDARWKVFPGKEPQSRSVAALPLLLGEEVFGVLMVNHSQVGYFRPEHLRLLNAIANEVTIAIHNAELYSYVSEQAERLGEMLMAREEEASKSRAILESIADGVIVSDPENRIILMNPAAERLFQTRTEIVTGRNVFDLYPMDASEARARLRQMMPELVIHGQPGAITASPVRFNIESRTVAASLAPVTGRNRELLGYVTVFRDVSKEVEAERLKNEFISTVSHELRTPMTSIKGYVDLLLLGAAGGITPAQNDFLRVIKTNTDRLVALVNDLLDISRIESGRIRLEIVPLFLADMINDVVTSSRTLIEERQQQLITRIEPDLPPILGDKGRIVQILNNLVSNAIKYTRPGGTITVTLDRWPGGQFPMLPGEENPPELPTKPYLYVSVTDTGVGISPTDQTKLFTRFFRADNPLSVEAGGTGLGLAIAKSLVELHGGRIWATSQLGVGSTFSFVLPVYEEEIRQSPGEAPEIAPESVAPLFTTGGPHHILVVDDEPNIAELISHQLRQVGYDISTATSGPEAIQLAQKNHPDLIILDVLMPEMDGFEVLSELKRHTETAFTPVIVLSVLRDGEEKGFALGAADYLTKPIDETALRSAVQRLLAHINGGEPKQILVVDDDRDITGWLVRSLSSSGFSTRAAYNGDEALQMIRESPPHLILLDLKMPGTDGYEVIRQLKGDATTRNIPIIVITASDLEGERTRIRVLGMGAQQLLSKPFSSDVLIKEIRNLIDGGEK